MKITNWKKMLILSFITCFFTCSVYSQNPGCEFDSIAYRQYSLIYLGSKGPFQDYKVMLEKDKPARYWTDLYENGRIIKRVFGETMVGTNRTETYRYQDGQLKEVIFSGGFSKSIDFFYDDKSRLIKSLEHSDIFGEMVEEFSYSGDTIIVKGKSSEETWDYQIVVDEQYNKNRYPYGNHIMYDEVFSIQRLRDPELYEYERYYDQCGNLQYLVRRAKETNNIWELTVFDIKYK